MAQKRRARLPLPSCWAGIGDWGLFLERGEQSNTHTPMLVSVCGREKERENGVSAALYSVQIRYFAVTILLLRTRLCFKKRKKSE